jgi:dTDP-4-dehydrorhamnose 3,5-epimerase
MSLELIPTPLVGVFVLRPAIVWDQRGSFARLTCRDTLAAQGIHFVPLQTSLSRSNLRGTLRGMHYQAEPAAETKVVHCISGAIHDIALDLRPDSPSFGQSFGTELTAGNARGLFIPAGCAHGFIALTDEVAMIYEIDRAHDPQAARGVRWNDPAFSIAWPIRPTVMSDRDATWPDHRQV